MAGIPSERHVAHETGSIEQFRLPDPDSRPLYPAYDPLRNAIWTSDTLDNSSRIWEFDIDKERFVEHKLAGINFVSKLAMGHDGSVWYIDPSKRILGRYFPANGTDRTLGIPTAGSVADLAVGQDTVWLAVSNLDQVIRYDVTKNTFESRQVPTPHGSPIGITINERTGTVWIVEIVGKVLGVDPSSFHMSEFQPGGNLTMKLPVAIKSDPLTSDTYISEHGEDAVFVFHPQNGTFKRLPLHQDPDALPFGMAFDGGGNLWVAEHTANKVAVLDPTTGQSWELGIPVQDPLTQYITSDSAGNIWLAEPGAASLGLVRTPG